MTTREIECDVAVVGSGPSGLAAATRLRELGIGRIVLLERDAEPGGVPRHCGHLPFGLRELRRITTGPRYARQLVARAQHAGVDIHSSTCVTRILPDARLMFTCPQGMGTLRAKRVILATGIRETPRSARLVSGGRPSGILTTGALQSMVYLAGKKPCLRPAIIGSELVSFSALLTCRHAGIRPVAMIEENVGITARPFSALLPWMQRIPLLRDTRITQIQGINQVKGIEVTQGNGETRQIDCDSVIFSGRFVPEASLCRSGHLQIDAATGGPKTDQNGRCSDATYFATGNLLRPVETAGWCWQEGYRLASRVAQDISSPPQFRDRPIRVVVDDRRLIYALPQTLQSQDRHIDAVEMQLRVNTPVSGTLVAEQQGRVIARRQINTRPERRILLSIPAQPMTGRATDDEIKIRLISQGH